MPGVMYSPGPHKCAWSGICHNESEYIGVYGCLSCMNVWERPFCSYHRDEWAKRKISFYCLYCKQTTQYPVETLWVKTRDVLYEVNPAYF